MLLRKKITYFKLVNDFLFKYRDSSASQSMLKLPPWVNSGFCEESDSAPFRMRIWMGGPKISILNKLSKSPFLTNFPKWFLREQILRSTEEDIICMLTFIDYALPFIYNEFHSGNLLQNSSTIPSKTSQMLWKLLIIN